MINEHAQVESLVCKANGIECLRKEAALPLFSVTQDRLYNNELKLSYPTRETTFPADRLGGPPLPVENRRLPLSRRRYLKTRLSMEQLTQALEQAGIENGTIVIGETSGHTDGEKFV